MSSMAESLNKRGNVWGIALAGIAALIIVVGGISNLHRSQMALKQTRDYAMQAPMQAPARRLSQSESYKDKSRSDSLASFSTALVAEPAPAAAKAPVEPAMDRKMLRSSSVEIVVRKPAEAAEKIRALAEGMGGFLVSSEVSGGPDAASGALTIRVPAARFEQQRAEFDALSKQIETVAITVSLRAEAEAQVMGLHWRPLYQMKLALRDGLDAVAEYGIAILSIVFYLPAVLLWTVTIVLGAALGWKTLRWV